MKLRRLLLGMRMAAWIAFLTPFGRMLPLRTMLRLLDTRRRAPGRWPPERIASLVDRVFRADIVHRSCWKRAAVLRRYLLLNGINTSVVFGVRKGEEELAGHAWLERDGEPFLEATPPDYVVTFRYPS